MNPKTIVFFGIILVLCVYTTSLLAQHTLQESHEKGTAAGKASKSKSTTSTSSPSKSTSKTTKPSQPTSIPSGTPGNTSPKTNTPKTNAPQTTPPKTNAADNKAPVNQNLNKKNPFEAGSDSKTAPARTLVKLCNFNKLSHVPSSNEHRFFVKTPQTTKYSSTDFEVTWPKKTIKRHSFFNKIGSEMNFDKAIKTMNCKRADVRDFGSVCGITTDLQKTFDVAFGKEPLHRCIIPQNSFIISVRFVLQLSDFATSPGGKWSVFTGLYSFKSQADAKKIIDYNIRGLAKQIKATKLNTFDINLNLNIIPEFVKGTLTWVFNSNINSPFAKSIQKNKHYDLADFGYAKILRPGTELIIGNIFDGTTAVKQICETAPFDNNNSCGVSV